MANALFLRAAELVEAHRYDEAEPILVNLHSNFPEDAKINYLLGVIYNHYRDLHRSLKHLIDSSKVATKRHEVFSLMSEVYGRMGKFEDSLSSARRGVALNNNSDYAQIILGDAYYNSQKTNLARQAYERAREINPSSASPEIGLYRLEISLGARDKAIEHLMKAYELESDNAHVLIELAQHADSQHQSKILDNIIKQAEDPNSNNSPEEIALLNFAAGKIFEKKSDIETAFTYYSKFKSAMYAPYSIKKRRWQLETIKGIFSKEFFEHRKDFGLKTDRPVFVVGMPRSGTTLVEQIIGRHPKATGVGELNFFNKIQTEMSEAEIVTPVLFERAISMDAKHAKRVGRKYLAELDKYDKKATRIIDKLPHNFEMLWLIALLFPNAKVIHTCREPADTCTSVFTTPLRSQHNYNIDLETLGEYYGLYLEMMEHWDKVLPIKIHHQSYEALIADQETQSRALLDYVGLPWDPVCLDFHSGNRQVTTFSREQVRQPIYSSSIGRWRKYEPYIQPLIKSLGKHAPKQ